MGLAIIQPHDIEPGGSRGDTVILITMVNYMSMNTIMIIVLVVTMIITTNIVVTTIIVVTLLFIPRRQLSKCIAWDLQSFEARQRAMYRPPNQRALSNGGCWKFRVSACGRSLDP